MSSPTVEPEAQKTPLYDEHVRLGGRIVPFAGWLLPVQFRGVTDEHKAVRTQAGLFDVSHMGELELRGPGAEAVLDGLVTADLAALAPGRAVYTCACNERGTILDDLIVYRRAPEHLLVVCNAGNRDKIRTHVARAADGKAEFTDASDVTALIAVQGPNAVRLAASLASDDSARGALVALPSFSLMDVTLAGVPCIAARTGYTGEDGLELFCAADAAVTLWRALLETDPAGGVSPIGLGARDTLRLEARLSLYGNDIDETTNPFEAGLGWIVKLDKARDFVGKSALTALKATPPARKLVGFVMVDRQIARHGYPIEDASGTVVGVCTSGGPGPTIGKNIGLGYVPSEHAAVGSRIVVDCRGRRATAEVVKTPFYKRQASERA